MKADEVKSWLMLVAAAGGAYLAWRFWDKLATAGDNVSKGVADAYVRVTAGPVIQVQARVVLPDGRRVPMQDIKIVDSRLFLFTYGGKRYRLVKRRPDNDYDSVLAGLFRGVAR